MAQRDLTPSNPKISSLQTPQSLQLLKTNTRKKASSTRCRGMTDGLSVTVSQAICQRFFLAGIVPLPMQIDDIGDLDQPSLVFS